MTRIILARHGRPVLDRRTRIPGHGLAAWLRSESDAPLDPASRPSPELEQLARHAGSVIASPLRRSVDSALLLAPAVEPTIEEDVREAALPSAFDSSFRLPPMLWAGVARCGWFCGWSAGVESLTAVRQRAVRAVQLLQKLSERHDVLVVGHGLMNAFLGEQLRARGWSGPLVPSRSHWAFGIYAL